MTSFEEKPLREKRYEVIEGSDPDSEQRWDVATCYSWHLDGVLHRPHDLPAREIYDNIDDRFELVGQEWWHQGKRHRDNGPALIERYHDRLKEAWYQDGVLHRADGPALTDFDILDGRRVATIEEWWIEGKLHRTGGQPARTYREASHGVIHFQQWYENGLRHRLGGPATEDRNEKTGALMTVQYWQFGKLHRTDGPAEIDYNAHVGTIERARYFLNDLEMNRDAYENTLRLG